MATLLSVGPMGNGDYFQLALIIFGGLCALYIIAYVVITRRRRAKEALRLHEEAMRLEQEADNILPSH